MTFELLKLLCEQNGISGRESSIVNAVKSYLSEFESATDALGNLLVTVKKPERGQKTVLLEAHADRIGLVVTSFLENGFVRVAKAGGIDALTLMGSEILIGGKNAEVIPGVIAAPFPYPAKPHNSAPTSEYKMPEISDMFVDTGLENPKKFIEQGAECVMKGTVQKLIGSRVAAPGLDNRAGCTAIILAAKALAEAELNVGVTLLFSSREEIGGMGAMTGGFGAAPDYAIAVDVGFAISPDVTDKDACEMGKGPEIDISALLDESLTNSIIETAKNKNIPHQLFVAPSRGTGTDADEITVVASGIKTALVSIPLRFMHHPVEVVDIADIESTAMLLAEHVKGMK
ncbi:MAG: M20/M25/M40 family metallo-hydrolase [Oscillospiraceae bacterium]